jgi:aryl-alcohol dehydrogenase-like predicted oxidoreductase
MQYNRLGDTGLIVSRLAFGAMTFGSAEGTVFEGISKVDQELAT